MENETERLEAAFVAGNMAFWQGAKYTSNPYTDRNLAYEWGKGWLEAEKDCLRENEAQLAEDREEYYGN